MIFDKKDLEGLGSTDLQTRFVHLFIRASSNHNLMMMMMMMKIRRAELNLPALNHNKAPPSDHMQRMSLKTNSHLNHCEGGEDARRNGKVPCLPWGNQLLFLLGVLPKSAQGL